MALNDSRWQNITLHVSTWWQIGPNGPKCLKMATNGSTWLYMAPNGSRLAKAQLVLHKIKDTRHKTKNIRHKT